MLMSGSAISIKVAWRNIVRQRGYSVIHVVGLAIGICACVVIYLIGRYELSFDRFHPDAGRIYRVVGEVRDKDGNTVFLNSPFQGVAGIEHLIPGFEAEAGFHLFGSAISVPSSDGGPGTTYDPRQEDGFALSTILTGPEFFRLFPHVWLAGSPAVLGQPGRIVLAESVAKRYFGPGAAGAYLNRTVIYDDSLSLTVAGIVRDWDQPSDLNYTSFISISTAPNSFLRDRIPTTDWFAANEPTGKRARTGLAAVGDGGSLQLLARRTGTPFRPQHELDIAATGARRVIARSSPAACTRRKPQRPDRDEVSGAGGARQRGRLRADGERIREAPLR